MKKVFWVAVGIFCFLSFGMPCYGSEIEDIEQVEELEEIEEVEELEDIEQVEEVKEVKKPKRVKEIKGDKIVETVGDFEDYYNSSYFALTLGAVLPQTADYGNTLKTMGNSAGIAVAAALGQSFGGWYRGEIEIGMQQAKIDNVIVKSGSFMNLNIFANAYLDFYNEGPFTPFVTGGIGCVRVSHDKLKTSLAGISIEANNAIVFGWQLGTGLGIELDKNNSIDLRYRYFHTADPNLKFFENMKNTSHSILLSIRHELSAWE